MCLIGLAIDPPGPWRLVLAANRDEYHLRPAAPAAWWPGRRIFAGRDLLAQGTWLGVSVGPDTLRIGALTNIRPGLMRAVFAQEPQPPSRGGLVTAWLESDRSAIDHLDAIAPAARRHAGFNLIVLRIALRAASDERDERGAGIEAGYLDNATAAPSRPRRLGAGLHAVSNATIDVVWPKTDRLRTALAQSIAAHRADADGGQLTTDLFSALADRSEARPAQLPSTGLDIERERLLSATFIADPDYGTRCSTVIAVGRDGTVLFAERSFGSDGVAIATVIERWRV